MNRQTKRITQRQEAHEASETNGSSAPVATRPVATERRAERRSTRRTTPMTFLREVRDELRQVAWPSRPEVINYSMVVLFTLVLMVALIFVLNFVFGKAVLFMFQK